MIILCLIINSSMLKADISIGAKGQKHQVMTSECFAKKQRKREEAGGPHSTCLGGTLVFKYFSAISYISKAAA